MAERWGKGDSLPKGKTLKKSVATKPGKQSRKDSSSMNNPSQIDSSTNNPSQIEIDSADSEYEGFLDDKCPSPEKENDDGASDLKTGKVSSTGLKSSDKTSFGTSSDWSKGGKGFSSGKDGGKGGLPQRKPAKTSLADKELKLELELPPGAKVVMDCEAAATLQGVQDHLDLLKDPKIKIPESFGNSLQYSKAAAHYTDIKSVRQALENLKEHGATDGEICMIGNASPETSEEAYALIPSLKEKKDNIGGPLIDALATLAKFKVDKVAPL